jgi:hypothetical protein
LIIIYVPLDQNGYHDSADIFDSEGEKMEVKLSAESMRHMLNRATGQPYHRMTKKRLFTKEYWAEKTFEDYMVCYYRKWNDKLGN